MIRPSALDDLPDTVHLVPQAIINVPISALIERLGNVSHIGIDDLDYFRGAAFWLDDKVPGALIQYRGYPEGEWSIHLPGEIQQVEDITGLVERVIRELDLPRDVLVWQRKDNPEL